jgi:DNA-directed RNA polymerase specialized sigma24 family protein
VLDLSVIKTAGALGISEGSVKTHTHRALHALETHLDSEHP